MSRYNGYIFTIVMVGDANTGKSCLVQQYASKWLNPEEIPTLCHYFKLKSIEINGKPCRLQIYSPRLENQDKFGKSAYYRGAHAMMLVFDLTDEESFQNIKYWLAEADRYGSENVHKVLIGNKSDLTMDRKIKYEDAMELARSIGIPYFETSALSCESVVGPFMAVASTLHTQKSALEPS